MRSQTETTGVEFHQGRSSVEGRQFPAVSRVTTVTVCEPRRCPRIQQQASTAYRDPGPPVSRDRSVRLRRDCGVARSISSSRMRSPAKMFRSSLQPTFHADRSVDGLAGARRASLKGHSSLAPKY